MEYVVDNGYGMFERSPESIAAQLSAWFSPSGRAELDAIAKRCVQVTPQLLPCCQLAGRLLRLPAMPQVLVHDDTCASRTCSHPTCTCALAWVCVWCFGFLLPMHRCTGHG